MAAVIFGSLIMSLRSLIFRWDCCGLLISTTQPDDQRIALSSEIQPVNINILAPIDQHIDHGNLPVIQYSQSARGNLELHHDIFLSHSGAQKGFVKDLYRVLSEHGLSTFLDITHHSLPLAEPFPKNIFDAASSCKLGVVVLSEAFMCTKWPMLELCAFARAKPFVKILPLFFHLSHSDMKDNQNLERWRKQWSSFAKSDPQRIDAKEWEEAVGLLLSENGLPYDPRSGGELDFIERIVRYMLSSQSIIPRNTYDTTYMQGEARLREIVLKKFEEMEFAHSQNHQGQQYNSTEVASSSRSGAVNIHVRVSESTRIGCVLGVHGLPGSGKSTLCRSLVNHFSRPYAGKSLHIELPTNPSPPALLQALQGLLKLVTLHIQTDPVAHIDKLVHVIKSHGLSRNAIFLAVDNICEKSKEEVSRILPHVIGPGSKVILTARTLEVLQSIILRTKRDQIFICDCIAMPSINEDEAMDILLQTTGRGVARGPDEARAQHDLPWESQLHLVMQKQKVLRVVRMCGFGDPKAAGPLEYLPVVMERMGAELIRHQNDVPEWVRKQERFWSSSCSSFNPDLQDVRVYREHIIMELISESFETSLISDELRLLFMDVALFCQGVQDIRPLYESCTSRLEEAYSILGSMHGRDAVKIRQMVRHLQRLCFVQRVSPEGLLVHDVYREFAKYSLNNRFNIHGDYGLLSYSESGKRRVFLDGKAKKNQDRPALRAMILDVGWMCEELVLQNFPHLKALIVINCKSLATFRMAGLTSLATLDVRGFGDTFPWLQCRDASLGVVKRINLGCLVLDVVHAGRNNVFFQGQYGKGLISKRKPDVGIAMRMRGLRTLMLRGTGIEKLENMGSCWPNLQELQVHECLLAEFRLGNLPALTNFVFKDCIHREHRLISYSDQAQPLQGRVSHTEKLSFYYWQELERSQLIGRKLEKSEVYLLEGKGFLMGCPSLQQVHITSAFFCNAHLMNPSCRGLRVLELVGVHTDEELPDLSSCKRTLQILTLASCNNLRHIDLSAGFESLTELTITQCDMLEWVKFSTSLPSLRRLVVTGMQRLDALSGLDDILVQLEFLEVAEIPLEQIGGVASSVEDLQECGRLQTLSLGDISRLKRRVESQHLSYLWDSFEIHPWDILCAADRIVYATSFRKPSDTRPFNFVETFSVTFLRDLTTLRLQYLGRLRRVDGIESLIHLTCLSLRGCEGLEELPSLHALQRMKMLLLADCVKLRGVQGVDKMRELRIAEFQGCRSLEELPFEDVHSIERSHPQLVRLLFEECKFACESRELMVEWAHEVELARVVRHAVLEHFLSEYYYHSTAHLREYSTAHLSEYYYHSTHLRDYSPNYDESKVINKKKLIGEALLPCLLNLLPLDEHNCIDFKRWEDIVEHHASYDYKWSNYVDEEKMVRLLKEQYDNVLRGKPKELLLQQLITLTPIFSRVLDASKHEQFDMPPSRSFIRKWHALHKRKSDRLLSLRKILLLLMERET